MLSLSDWRYFLQSWILLLWVDLLLRTVPYRRVSQWFIHPVGSNAAPASASDFPFIRRAYDLVELAANNHLYPMTCLRRAIVLHNILNRRGIRSQICFGVNKENGDLNAHAWLEADGVPLGQPQSIGEQFARLGAQMTES